MGEPYIDGPCNDPIDIDDNNEPEISMSVVYSDSSEEGIEEVASLDEGVNTIRWEVEDPIENYEHVVHLYAQYNNKRQDVFTDVFIAGSSDETGLWELTLDGSVCDLRVWAQVYVKESNTWESSNSISESLGYTGSTSACDYTPDFTVSKKNAAGDWVQSPEALDEGVNQLRFDLSNVNLIDNMSYYVNAYVQSDGGSSSSYSGYFNIGNPTYGTSSSSASYDLSSVDDIYLNFTTNDWTCSAYAYGYVYYITPNNGWYTLASMQTHYFDTPECDPAGDLSLSGILDGEWEEDLDSESWELPAGTTDLYLNMTDLNVGERYKLYFYVHSSQGYLYQSSGTSGSQTPTTSPGTSSRSTRASATSTDTLT